MKGAVETTETFKYIILFTFLFAAFLTLAITYNKAFRLKNETLTILEKYEGNQNGFNIINNYLQKSSYKTVGKCNLEDNKDVYGVIFGENNNLPELVDENKSKNKNYNYCITYRCKDEVCGVGRTDDAPNGNYIYYDVTLFYKFNLPIIGDILTFNISGETKAISLYDEFQKFE